MTQKHDGLPVSGYRPQSVENVALVNEMKQLEERVLRKLDEMQGMGVDQRWLATGRTQLEKAFMSINRSVFQPSRVMLDEEIKANLEANSQEIGQ
jgi:hypothetical protein